MIVRISNLPSSHTDYELIKMFEKFGQIVSTRVVVDRYSINNLNIGFVELSNETHALRAIKELNGLQIEEEIIEVIKTINQN